MKKLLVAIATLACAGNTYAGDFHVSSTLRCSQCHTMHASRQHQLNAAGEDLDFPLAAQGNPQRNLLIQDGTNATCLACHDNAAAYPDVLGANTGSVDVNLRSAGALNGSIGTNDPLVFADFMGHTLGSADAPPGWIGIYEPSPQENFNCANCHAVHGSAAYRNLGLSPYMGTPNHAHDATNPFASAGPTYNAQDLTTGLRATTVNNGTLDVVIGTDARNYATTAVTFGIGSSNTTATNGMNAYCAVCHGNFHGDANTRDLIGGVDFVRHPTSGVQRADTTLLYQNDTSHPGMVDQTALVRPAWVTGPNGAFEAACLTCHKGHGNARGYALLYPEHTAAPADFENGDALAVSGEYPIRNLCITCHPMGR